MLLEASSELGCLNDRAGRGKCGLWLRATVTISLVQLGGQGKEKIAMNAGGKYVCRGRLGPQIKSLGALVVCL